MEDAYMIQSDADKYARLTGYLHFPDNKTQSPGLEALFHKAKYKIRFVRMGTN